MSAFGLSMLDLLLLIVGFVSLGSSTLPQCCACSSLLPLLRDLVSLGFLSAFQMVLRLGPIPLVMGIARFSSFLPIPNGTLVGTLFIVKTLSRFDLVSTPFGAAHLGLSVSALDFALFASPALPRSYACLGVSVLMPDVYRPSAALVSRRLSRTSTATLISSLSHLRPLLFVLDFVNANLPASIRCCG